MPKEEWGTKRVCPKTGRRFYDLGRDPIISPYTGEIVELEAGAKSRMALSVKPEESDDDALSLVDDNDTEESSGKGTVQVDDELLEDDDEDSVSLDEIADVAADEDDS